MAKRIARLHEKHARGEKARQKLIHAGMKLFGDLGFEATSVRDIAKHSGQNIGSITYYFGNKEGLYLAVAEEMIARIHALTNEPHLRIKALLDGECSDPEQYLHALTSWFGMMAMAINEKGFSLSFAKIVSREEITPTKVLDLLHKKAVLPLHRLLARLVAAYIGAKATDQKVIVATHSLISAVLGFRLTTATILVKTGWKKIGPKEAALIAETVSEHAELVLRGLRAKGKKHGK